MIQTQHGETREELSFKGLENACQTSPKLNTLKLTMERHFSRNLLKVQGCMLHQARLQNFDPQILGKWAIEFFQNIVVYNENEQASPS